MSRHGCGTCRPPLHADDGHKSDSAPRALPFSSSQEPVMRIRDADKAVYFDSPVSPTSLFGPAVDGFAERFTAGQKSSQAMQHFLPKCSSSSASSRPKPVPAQQPPKNKPPATQPTSRPEHRRRSRSAKRHPPPNRQGPRPRIVLDPAPQKSA
ncbi:hypothetical protein DPX16_16822 [Anabarilius grahami]|uniref:Uncharacterized protein n=1 Tax=Anabarilius grahami TaxID=495550 RepID=A0A3N0YSN3_ANAGA|nr:hypothetical protein DPX16_16822 [Anabarilius grahami]